MGDAEHETDLAEAPGGQAAAKDRAAWAVIGLYVAAMLVACFVPDVGAVAFVGVAPVIWAVVRLGRHLAAWRPEVGDARGLLGCAIIAVDVVIFSIVRLAPPEVFAVVKWLFCLPLFAAAVILSTQSLRHGTNPRWMTFGLLGVFLGVLGVLALWFAMEPLILVGVLEGVVGGLRKG